MAHRFPDLPIFAGFDAPGRIEANIFDLEFDGEVPTALDGTFFRVAPDPEFPPKLGTDIFFNGDGMVCAFRFKAGRVHFRSRYACTERFLAERNAGKALFGAYRNPFTDDPSVAGKVRGTANTNVVVHGGRLLALKEDSPPTAMNPRTLETTESVFRFDGGLTSETFTAHPKVDPATGEMISINYEAKGLATADFTYCVINKEGKVTRELWLKAPYPAMIHDIGVTENYVIIPLMPLTVDVERLKAGKPHFTYRPDLDQVYGILPRSGEASDLRWFHAPHGLQGHAINAFDEDGKVYLDIGVTNGNVFPFFPEANGRVQDIRSIRGGPVRWTFDMRSNVAPECRPLMLFGGEFPHVDDRYGTRPYRHAYAGSMDPTTPYDFQRCGPPTANFFLNTVMHIDTASGATKKWSPGPTSAVQEPVFAPRSADAPEGEGYVLVLVSRLLENRSDLVVLDAQHVEEGPLATIHLPIRLRSGLHGNWVPASAMAAGLDANKSSA